MRDWFSGLERYADDLALDGKRLLAGGDPTIPQGKTYMPQVTVATRARIRYRRLDSGGSAHSLGSAE